MSDLDALANAYQSEFPYHAENLGMQTIYAELLCAAIRNRGARRVLSLGIGHSAISDALIGMMPSPVERYIIVEGSQRIIERFTQGHAGREGLDVVHFYFEDFETLERFDVIEMGFVLEHVADPGLLLTRMKRYLNKGGMLGIAVPNARSLHRIVGVGAGFLDDILALSSYDRQLGHRRYFDRMSLQTLIEDCGFQVETVRGLMLKPLTTAQLAAANLEPRVMEALYRCALELPDVANSLYIEAALR
jgi:2-polyprenyl-3-methyl-5-hydroxy-6-metoxy-1,4-benzoquinol methylase